MCYINYQYKQYFVRLTTEVREKDIEIENGDETILLEYACAEAVKFKTEDVSIDAC